MGILNSNTIVYDKVITDKTLIDFLKTVLIKPEEPTIHTLRVGPYIISGTDYAQVIKKFVEVCKEQSINEEK